MKVASGWPYGYGVVNDFVDERVEQGVYSTPSEFIRELLSESQKRQLLWERRGKKPAKRGNCLYLLSRQPDGQTSISGEGHEARRASYCP